MEKEEKIWIEREWNKWYSENKNNIPYISTEEVKESVEKELKTLSQMSVEEYTLYRKWVEINTKYNKRKDDSLDVFFDDIQSCDPYLQKLKSNIWIPNNPEDYLKLKPIVVWTNNKPQEKKIWSDYRRLISTMPHTGSVGRHLTFNVWDEVTGKLLGIFAISSDFMDLTARDDFIGWSREQRSRKGGPLLNTAIGSTIIPTQPLGFSYCGGKLIALLTVSDVVVNAYEKQYGDILAGITTTSLYGSFSQYDRLKYWKKMGKSRGTVKFEPSRETIDKIKLWLQYHHTKKYWLWYHCRLTLFNKRNTPAQRDYRQRSLSFAYRQLGIDKNLFETNHQRGVYFCQLYENSKEFLREEIDKSQIGEKLFDNSVDSMVNLWKEKYAIKRVKSLINRGLYKSDTLFYDDIIGISWEQTKNRYLKEVGR